MGKYTTHFLFKKYFNFFNFVLKNDVTKNFVNINTVINVNIKIFSI
jgi:hypothetical protein